MKSMPPGNNVAKDAETENILILMHHKSHAINLPDNLPLNLRDRHTIGFRTKGVRSDRIQGWRNRVNLPEYELQLWWDPIEWSCDCNKTRSGMYAVVVLGGPLCMPSIKQPRWWIV